MTEESVPAPETDPFDAAQYAAPQSQYAAPPFLDPPDPAVEARRKQRRRNTLRWTGAVVLAAVLGAGSGLAVIHPKRTEIPGLATAADGRYVFPPLVLPTLAPGEPAPGDSVNNPGGQHLADIRKLLLPKPHGAVANKSLPGSTGWLPESTLAAMTNASIPEELSEYGLRHTAAAGWKTPDGASTAIYLLQFPDNDAAATGGAQFTKELNTLPHGAAIASFNPTGTSITANYYTLTSHGKTTRYSYFTSGDTLVLITFSAPATVSITPFEQEIQLQTELLQ